MTPPVSIVKVGGSTIVVFAVFYIIFSTSALIGAQAVGNDTTDVDDLRGNLSDIEPNMRENIRENVSSTGPDQPANAYGSVATSHVSTIASGILWGFDFGVAYPTAAVLNARMAPWVFFSAAWTFLSRRIGNNRGVQQW